MQRVKISVMDISDLLFVKLIISPEMGYPYWVDNAQNLASISIRKLLCDGLKYWLIVYFIQTGPLEVQLDGYSPRIYFLELGKFIRVSTYGDDASLSLSYFSSQFQPDTVSATCHEHEVIRLKVTDGVIGG